ncbi:hypothetical protein ACVGWW_13435, partial [Enterobacter hormaechei]
PPPPPPPFFYFKANNDFLKTGYLLGSLNFYYINPFKFPAPYPGIRPKGIYGVGKHPVPSNDRDVGKVDPACLGKNANGQVLQIIFHTA